ncbi:hypothetical protein AB0A60_28435 [Streptomyces sp. NPDC046275]|uniref:hypothetical protein n=1 Tax=Streptomyces sp. NPDC046275 TaxID=3157201 RepID=UPI00340B58E5
MATLLGMLVLVGALTFWAGATVVGWSRARHAGRLPRPPRPRPSPARLAALTAGLALLAGGAVHAYGLTYLPTLFPEDACWFNAGAKVTPDSSGALPVSLVCNGEEIVPGWLNPALLVLGGTGLAATVTSVVLATRARAQRRAAARTGGGGDV